MKGDVILSLKTQREITALLDAVLAYHTDGVEDDYGETEEERKATSFKHDDFDILHETVIDPTDAIMKGCPQCGSITRLRLVKQRIEEAANA